MNILFIIKMLVGTYYINISNDFIVVSSSQDETTEVKEVLSVLVKDESRIYFFNKGTCTQSILLDDFPEPENINVTKVDKTRNQEEICEVICDEYILNVNVSNYLNGKGEYELVLKKLIGHCGDIDEKDFKYFNYLPSLGTKDIGAKNNIVYKSIEITDDEAHILLHEIIDIQKIDGFSEIEIKAINEVREFINRR